MSSSTLFKSNRDDETMIMKTLCNDVPYIRKLNSISSGTGALDIVV